MTLHEFDDKIDQLKTVRNNATGLQKAKLTGIVDDLVTKRTELITGQLAGLSLSNQDNSRLEEIAEVFENAAEEVENANSLVDDVVRIGKKLVELIF